VRLQRVRSRSPTKFLPIQDCWYGRLIVQVSPAANEQNAPQLLIV